MVEVSKTDFSPLCRGPTPTPRAPHTDPTRTPCAPLIGHAPDSTLAWSKHDCGQSAVFRLCSTSVCERRSTTQAMVFHYGSQDLDTSRTKNEKKCTRKSDQV
jgi:hypothetical protein